MSEPTLGSTYRLQLHGLGLAGAAKLVPYLDDLGIETLYLSPILEAAPGSTHGYDVVDATRIDPALGTEEDLETLFTALVSRGMRTLLDIVPNHMAIDPANAWWWDVLRDGQHSPEADVFDIDWSDGGRVVVPTLGRPLDEVLAEGACVREGDIFRIDGQPFPLAQETSDGSPVDVLADQHYRPAYWRTGDTEGNYRRFFDIGTLIGIRVEDSAVFARTHERILSVAEDAAVAGLRVDHIDGLADPRTYLLRLNDRLGSKGLTKLVIVEKILAADELLDARWPVAGTTGYEFGDRLFALFLDPQGCDQLLEFGAAWTSCADPSFAALSSRARREVVDRSFSGDLDRLTRSTRHALDLETPGHDLSLRDLRQAWVELTIHMTVYRTYLEEGAPSAADRSRVLAASSAATTRGSLEGEVRRALESITAFLLGTMKPAGPWLEVARRWQQLSGAVMAKGSEDTATYRWVGLPVQADVGGDPDRTDDATEAFHRSALTRMESLNTTSTHDSKRNEDARCRLAVLSEAAEDWASLVAAWHELDPASDAVEPLEELRVYESLYALWPAGRDTLEADVVERVKRYVVKAAREAKEHTSWTDPRVGYEDMVRSFVDDTMVHPEFRRSMSRFCEATGPAALSNILALVVLKAWAPGVPDFYQGTELVEPTLTDPDNRRAVDFAARAELLASLPDPSSKGAAELLSAWPDGRLKLALTRTLLQERRRQAMRFVTGSYERVATTTDHAVAFLRRWEDRGVLAVVPRLSYQLAGPGRHPIGDVVWSDERVLLPAGTPRRYRDLLTGRILRVESDHIRLAELFAVLPVAALSAAADA